MYELTLTIRAFSPSLVAQLLRGVAQDIEQGRTNNAVALPDGWLNYHMEQADPQPIQQLLTPEEQAQAIQRLVMDAAQLAAIHRLRSVGEEVEAGEVELDTSHEGTDE